MAINTYNEIKKLIQSKLYLFDRENLESEGDLEFLREYIFAIENAPDTATMVAAVQELRNQILALDSDGVTLSEVRALSDIFHASDLGAVDDVKLDGITSKTIARTIGVTPLTTTTKTSLVDAINDMGDVSTIKLDGETSAVSLAAAIGTSPLETDAKGNLIDAINEVNTKHTNILVSDGDVAAPTMAFYKCTYGTTNFKQDQDIAVATYASNAISAATTAPGDLLNGMVKCVKFANEVVENNMRFSATNLDGSEDAAADTACVNIITSKGDALAHCLGAIIDVNEYNG